MHRPKSLHGAFWILFIRKILITIPSLPSVWTLTMRVRCVFGHVVEQMAQYKATTTKTPYVTLAPSYNLITRMSRNNIIWERVFIEIFLLGHVKSSRPRMSRNKIIWERSFLTRPKINCITLLSHARVCAVALIGSGKEAIARLYTEWWLLNHVALGRLFFKAYLTY